MATKQTQQNIPEGWKLVPAGEVFSFVKSYAFSRENLSNGELKNGGIGNIHYGDIHSTFATPSIDLDKISIPTIKDQSFVPDKDSLLKDGDLIMADASEDYEGVGVTVSLHGIGDKKVVGGLHTFVLRDKSGKTDEYFRQYIFKNPVVKNALQRVANGVSVYGISKNAISRLLLPIPPLKEQRKIAQILSTWDTAIEKISTKIDFKKKVSEKLTHDLLSGKVRLAGFNDPWQELRLGELYEITSSKRVFEKDWKISGIPFYRAREIVKLSENGYVKNELFIAREMYQDFKKKYGVPQIDDLLVTGVGTIGEVYRVKDTKEFYFKDGNIIWLKNNGLVSSEFVEHLFKTSFIRKQILGASPITTVATYTIDAANKTRVKIPIIAEQEEINKILSKAYFEVTLLKKRLELLKSQKQYLLGHLVSGSLRVPAENPNVGIETPLTAA